MYSLEFTMKANKGLKEYMKDGDKASLKKLDKLLEELIEHPRSGTGHPEQLKGYPNKERWSRHITNYTTSLSFKVGTECNKGSYSLYTDA